MREDEAKITTLKGQLQNFFLFVFKVSSQVLGVAVHQQQVSWSDLSHSEQAPQLAPFVFRRGFKASLLNNKDQAAVTCLKFQFPEASGHAPGLRSLAQRKTFALETEPHWLVKVLTSWHLTAADFMNNLCEEKEMEKKKKERHSRC